MSAEASGRPERRADIVVCPGGPMLVRGDVVIETEDGVRHESTRPVSAVCRCEKSARKPWCDGTHKLLPGWR
ncbi:CDGSH iron-sulfur domain-containing protein [Nocardioides litoris]|uniref:CDGSH iron-sulfur domain-containing protein n=1 Tax=Nocardioides litoris TaxID=1926648 RepID=UPI001FE38327|nr:CDGSH iron-sulfur domain-containing protein [Nocardioides litoris]